MPGLALVVFGFVALYLCVTYAIDRATPAPTVTDDGSEL